MFPSEVYMRRRGMLRAKMTSGLVLLLSNPESPMNYPANMYRYRQDSSFLYFIGLDRPGFAAVLDIDNGSEYLFGDDVSLDDIIWMGPQPSVQEQAEAAGIANSRPFGELAAFLEQAAEGGRRLHVLPPYRGENKILLARLLGKEIAAIDREISKDLIRAVVQLRSVKDAYEIAELERAAAIGYRMHLAAMQIAAPGVYEREISGEMEGIALRAGGMLSFPPIVTRRGETLHNHDRSHRLQEGDLLLIDCGAETAGHYASDNTRTLPVGGKFSPRQRDVYGAVLAGLERGCELVRPGVTYRSVHLEVCKVLAAGLKGLGLLRGDIDAAVHAGAHALFMPHGLGHMLGLDVHDMEDLGEDYVGYDAQVQRDTQFGLASLRLGRTLQPGFVLTVEPGLYFIPALIDKWQQAGHCSEFVDYEKVQAYRDCGGIRLEDNVLVTDNGGRQVGKRIPVGIDEVEAAMA